MKIKYIDLFSGIGGFRHSFEESLKKTKHTGECVGFSEIDPFAIKTYQANFNSNKEINFGDITKIDAKKLPSFDFLFAGFPCQPFSLMGKKKGFADTRGTMFFYVEKIIKEKKPKFILLENVRGLLTHDRGRTHQAIVDILEKKLGYKTVTWMLNSSDYGIPQTRRRMYLLGFLDEKMGEKIHEPKRKKLTKSTWHLLEKNVDNKYYLSDKTLKIILSNGSGKFKSKSEINQLIARPLTATMHKMHRACQDNYFSDSFVKGEYDSLSKEVYETPFGKKKIRKITPLEAFRLQGYPDRFVTNAQKAGISNTQLYRQAGNSITINVLKSIFSEVLKNLN